jgi:predicted PolB exonuclease-like 3'-5' exonuclease
MSSVQLQGQSGTDAATRTAFLVVDTESIPDGRLLNLVKYAGQGLTHEQAIDRAREEAREDCRKRGVTESDFIPYSFQIPVAICVARVGSDFSLQAIATLDGPLYRTREIVRKFWLGLSFHLDRKHDDYNPLPKLVTFNGRGFDLPLLELAAFRYGFSAKLYYLQGRNRFKGDLDLCDWMTNFGAARGMNGGLNLLAKLLGKPGKMDVTGDQVYAMYKAGRYQEINDYCMFDTLDTYFVFLRTRILTGDISPEQEADLVEKAKKTLATQTKDLPALKQYLDNWVDGSPWP